MNWINLSDAENKLRNKEFDDKEALKYLIASVIMYSLIGLGFIEANWTVIVSVILGIGLSIWGIKAVFTANTTGDGAQFFKRYIVLSWIIGFRLLLLSFIVMIPAIIIIKIFEEQLILNNTDPVDIFTMLFGFVFTIVYYLQFIKSIKRISLI